jgi:hypothetical protein
MPNNNDKNGNTDNSPTRRQWLATSAGAISFFWLTRPVWAASDFWNKKDASAWSSEELLELTTRSPWAQTARVEFKARGGADINTMAGRDTGGNGTAGARGTQGPMGGGGRSMGTSYPIGGPKEEPRRISETETIVRWESAQPLLDALRYPMPEDFVGHYVIGVSNLPDPRSFRRRPGDDDRATRNASAEDLMQQLQTGASLKTKTKDSVGAGVVQTVRKGSVVLFGFSKELLPITPGDKDILFVLNTEALSVKARFEPKEMMYRGKLAL